MPVFDKCISLGTFHIALELWIAISILDRCDDNDILITKLIWQVHVWVSAFIWAYHSTFLRCVMEFVHVIAYNTIWLLCREPNSKESIKQLSLILKLLLHLSSFACQCQQRSLKSSGLNSKVFERLEFNMRYFHFHWALLQSDIRRQYVYQRLALSHFIAFTSLTN